MGLEGIVGTASLQIAVVPVLRVQQENAVRNGDIVAPVLSTAGEGLEAAVHIALLVATAAAAAAAE